MFPSRFGFYTQQALPRDERPIPGSYSASDVETIDQNRMPINAYPEEFLVHMGLSRNFYDSAGEVPTFLDADNQGGCSSFVLLPLERKYILCLG